MSHEANKRILWIRSICCEKILDHAGKNFSNVSETELNPKWFLEIKKYYGHEVPFSVGLSESAS